MRPICFYHSSDYDGKCSAAIVALAEPDVELYPINYGYPFPWDDIVGRKVYMVDFSLQPFREQAKLSQLADPLIWLDHHESVYTDMEGSEDQISSKAFWCIEIGTAGCELTWLTLMKGKPMPMGVRLLGRYDVWDEKGALSWENDVMPFQYGLRRHNTDPRTPEGMQVWRRILDGDEGFIDSTMQDGRIILEYQADQDRQLIKSNAFEAQLKGHRALVVNRHPLNSRTFASQPGVEGYDLLVGFAYSPKAQAWTFSVYTLRADVDCGELCRQLGGGGHRKAAGFQTKVLPFPLEGLPSFTVTASDP